ncbi:hypothetical protein KIPB_014870 [Kipferlia bialata]|uniref:Uncharacterized protein n=1 Tax=Kipferlia bialata TaxID=797122 RepID=A0A9K3DC56_9EUKA|nr:hypothetical protein KIPB_014870 [Kipferlia bialata]|eukprot:g14870.t1
MEVLSASDMGTQVTAFLAFFCLVVSLICMCAYVVVGFFSILNYHSVLAPKMVILIAVYGSVAIFTHIYLNYIGWLSTGFYPMSVPFFGKLSYAPLSF